MKSRTVISQKIEQGQYFCHLIDRTMVNGQNKIFACGTKLACVQPPLPIFLREGAAVHRLNKASNAYRAGII